MQSLKSALINIRRMPYKSMAAILIISITFFVAYTVSLLMLGSQEILTFFEARPKVIAFFDIKTEDYEVGEVKSDLEKLDFVEEITLISKEEALSYYQDNQDNPLLLELVTADILPASIEVAANSPEELTLIEERLNSYSQIDDVILQKDVITQLTQWTNSLRTVGLGLTIIFLVLSLLTIISIISFKVSHQRKAISILRIIGAGSGYIVTPYIYEGFIYGLLGSSFGWGLMYAGFLYLTPWLTQVLGQIITFPLTWQFFAIQYGLGTCLALFFSGFASMLAARKLIKN